MRLRVCVLDAAISHDIYKCTYIPTRDRNGNKIPLNFQRRSPAFIRLIESFDKGNNAAPANGIFSLPTAKFISPNKRARVI